MQSAICIVDISSYDNLTIRYMTHHFSFLFFLSCVPKNAQQMYFPNCAIMVFAKMVHLIVWLELFLRLFILSYFNHNRQDRLDFMWVSAHTHRFWANKLAMESVNKENKALSKSAEKKHNREKNKLWHQDWVDATKRKHILYKGR